MSVWLTQLREPLPYGCVRSPMREHAGCQRVGSLDVSGLILNSAISQAPVS